MGNKAQVIISATDRTKAAFDSAKRNVEGLTSSLFGVKNVIGGLIGSAGFAALIKSTTDQVDKLQKLSQSLNVGTEALSQYRLIAERSGTTIDSLALIWQRQTRRVAEAANGTGEARDALRELGLQAEELNKLQADQQFEVIAEAMSRVENQADKLRLAFKLFDSEGARPALQAMADGAEGLRAMREEADRMGLTITQLEANQLAAFNDQLTNIKQAVGGVAQQIVIAMGPALEATARWFSETIVTAREFWSTLGGRRADDSIRSLEQQRDTLIENAEAIRQNIEIMKGIPNGERAVAGLEARYKAVSDQIKQINQQLLDSPITGLASKFTAPDLGGVLGAPLPSLKDEDATKRADERAKAELERQREHLLAKVELIRESTLTERELENERHQERLDLLDQYAAIDQEKFQEAAAIREQLEVDHQERLRKIEEKSEKDRTALQLQFDRIRKQSLTRNLSSALGILATHNKKLFEINKIAGIAEALISTYQAADQALRTLPFPANLAAAAAITTYGLSNVLAIKNTSFNGTGGGGGGGGGGATVPRTSTSDYSLPDYGSEKQPTAQEVTINVGDSLGGSVIRDFIEKFNEQLDDGVLIKSIRLA